jgi:hypothetical protein
MEMRAKPARAEMAKQQFGEESLFEYHLYTLDRKTTLKENQTKQISLLSGMGAAVRKEYVVNGQNFYYHNRQSPGTPLKDKVETLIELKNSKENNLGLPLPKGVLRVYKADTRGGQQLIGEDQIDHTPKDETVRVKLGNAFDIVAERNQTDFQVIAERVLGWASPSQSGIIDQPITVVVNEPIGGDWRMPTSFEHEKTAAFAARFKVPVERNGEAKLTYRVRARY